MNKEDLGFSVPSDLLLSQLVEEKNKEKLHPSILQLDHEEDGIYYVNSYSLSIEEDEDFMPLMQAAYDKLPDCNVMFSSVDDFHTVYLIRHRFRQMKHSTMISGRR